MQKYEKTTEKDVDYLIQEDLNEVYFKGKLEKMLNDVRSGKVKTTSLAEARKIYGERVQR